MFSLINHSCIEEYNPKVTESEHLLIVDGGITSSPGPYTVKLNLSSGIQEVVTVPVTDAVVVIEEKDGISETLTGDGQGGYSTAKSGIRAREGREYRLSIQVDDRYYESGWEQLKPCPPVDSLYWCREQHPGRSMDYDGIQVYIDTHDPANSTRYYRWEFIEDWVFSVPISSSWNPSVCYAHNSSSSIIIASTERFQIDRLVKQPITYVDHTTTRLTLRYRIILIQHAISQEEFRYWEAIEKLNENLGTLFDPIPATIRGNMRNTGNPDESVLGYFTCSSVRTDTMYVDAEEFVNDPIYFISPYSYCNYAVIRGENNPDIARYLKFGWLLADTIRDGDVLVTTMANSSFCFDCTTAGSAEPPVNWKPR